MPNTNGRIYTNKSTNPPIGVSIADVQTVMNVTTNTVGGLCTSNKVNKWARWKPLNVQQIQPLTYTQDAINFHFGLDVLSFHGKLSDFARELATYATFEWGGTVNGKYKGWKDGVYYNKPTSHYRIDDFACKENDRFGYNQNAQLLWNQPGTSHAIGSAIGDGAEIDLAEVEDYQDIPDDSVVFNETNLNINIAQQTNLGYNSISAPELLESHGYTGGGFRGLVLTDGHGGAVYYCIETIPWEQWKVNVQEAALFGDWYYLEFYTNANPSNEDPVGDYYLIPGMMGICHISDSGGGQGSIIFQPSPDNGIVRYDPTLMKDASHVEFARVAGDRVEDWYLLEVIVNKIEEGGATSEYVHPTNITTLDYYTSGYKWYTLDFGIELGERDNYGDTFELVIQGRHSQSDSTRVVHRSRFVLTP